MIYQNGIGNCGKGGSLFYLSSQGSKDKFAFISTHRQASSISANKIARLPGGKSLLKKLKFFQLQNLLLKTSFFIPEYIFFSDISFKKNNPNGYIFK